MAQKVWLGSKLRRLRRQRHLAQAEVARRSGISPSYLNLIEHNQRPLTAPLQVRLAEVLEVDPSAFSRDDDGRLLADLQEVTGDATFPSAGLDPDKLRDLIGHVPEAGRALLLLFQAYRRARGEVESLAERLSEDTYLSTSTHELRNLLATVRSFAEILHDNEDMNPAQRRRFHAIMVEQCERLTDNINQMLAFVPGEGLKSLDSGSTPVEEVTDFIQSRENHFPELERAAEALVAELGETGAAGWAGVCALLARAFEVRVEVSAEPPAARPAKADPLGIDLLSGEAFDAGRGLLWLSDSLGAESRTFRAVRRLAALGQAALLDRLLERAGLTAPSVRPLACRALANYLAAAVLMPYDAVLAAAEATRYDLERLQHRFGVSFEQVGHRLTSLRRPGRAGVPFHFLRADIAGNISKRFSASGLRIPRFGPACPRWNVHTAFMNHGRIETQVAAFPDGGRYLVIARALTWPGRGWRDPPSHYAIALGCRLEHADALIYGDGLALGAREAAVPVGVTCRLCERLDCRQRAAPPLLAADRAYPRTAPPLEGHSPA